MGEVFVDKDIKCPTTQNEWADVFEKIAEDVNPKTVEDLTTKVAELFHGNEIVNNAMEKWLQKIAYDKNKLKQVFHANSFH